MSGGIGRPRGGWWTAGEALGWIAFGLPVPGADWREVPGLGPLRAWGGSSPELLAAMEARAAEKPWRPEKAPPFGARHYRARVRRLMRETDQSADVLAEDLRRDMARDAICAARVKRAELTLQGALAARRLQAWGQPTRDIGEPPSSDTLIPIPAENFAGPSALMVKPNGWTFPPLRGRRYEGRWWQGVCFEGAPLQAAFPAKGWRDEAPAGLPAPKPGDLPASWTLLECLAWIAFRDTAIVRDASLETPRAATTHWAEVNLPGRESELAEITGDVGYGWTRLILEWEYERARGCLIGVLAPHEAEADLLAKLRNGTITASGRTADDGALRQMHAHEWRGLVLRERRSVSITAEPDQMTGQAWHDVAIPRDDALREWPPAVVATPIPGPARDSPPTSDSTLLRPEYMLRIARWQAARRSIGDLRSPSFSDDAAWSQRLFGHMPRATLRALREELAPESWSKPGKRSGTIWRD